MYYPLLLHTKRVKLNWIFRLVQHFGCTDFRTKQGHIVYSFEVFVRRLRIRIVSQGVPYVLVGLGSCLLFRMCFFTDSRGYTLYIFLYVSFAALDVCSFFILIGFTVHHSLRVTFFFPDPRLFFINFGRASPLKKTSPSFLVRALPSEHVSIHSSINVTCPGDAHPTFRY